MPLPPIPLAEAPLLFLDLEMTGLDPEQDRICEVCALRCRGPTEEEALETLVRSERGGGVGQQVHQISEEELARAPTFLEVAPILHRLLDGAVLVAHGTDLDERFLAAELGRVGLGVPVLGVLDTLQLAKRCFAAPTYRLGFLSHRLGLLHPRQHRAGDDARATRQLFWRTVEELAPADLADLGEVQVGECRVRPVILAKAKQLAGRGEAVWVRYRPSGRGREEFAYVITEVRADMDPPVVMGYLHPGRGRKELRADRILAIFPMLPPGDPRAPA
ncbi:MAG: 3'-5' exonuclease [Myxococcales bacterium]|nr:3'-5' exonuclease [Polyangiaceae bacterium]MDW8250341.1 3'-5' exonuclease [Myxococcales bacterium]